MLGLVDKISLDALLYYFSTSINGRGKLFLAFCGGSFILVQHNYTGYIFKVL